MDIQFDNQKLKRLHQLARSDSDVDVDALEQEVRYRYMDGQKPSKPVQQEEDGGRISFSPQAAKRAAQIFDIRGATVRPGLGSGGLANERLNNNPGKNKEYSVSNPDRVPLKQYRKMAKDPVLSLAKRLLKGWCGGLNYDIRTSDPLIEGVLEHCMKKVWKTLSKELLDGAVVNGFAFAEKTLQREDVILDTVDKDGGFTELYRGKIVCIENIKNLDPDQNFKYYKDTSDKISRVTQRQRGGEISVKRDKLVWFALDKEYSNIFGNSRFNAAYEPWYYSKIVIQQMLKHLERLGSPHLEIQYPKGVSRNADGTSTNNQDVALDIAEMMQSMGVVMFPSETDDKGNSRWSFEYADTDASGIDKYLEILNELERRMFFAVGIPHLVGKDQNYSNIDALIDILIVMLEDIVGQLESVVKDDVVDQLVEYNFGPEYISKVEFKIDRSALNQRKLWKDILKESLRLGFSVKGRNPANIPDNAKMMDNLGIPYSSFEHILFEDGSEDGGSDDESEGPTPAEKEQRKEDSNNRDRKTERESDEDRPTSSSSGI